MNIKRISIAVLLSPIIALLITALAFLIYPDDHTYSSYGPRPVFLLIFIVNYISIIYILTIFIALPLHLFFNKYKITNFFVYLLTGTAIGIIYGNLKIDAWATIPGGVPHNFKIVTLLFSGIFGAITSTSFWCFAVKSHNKSLKERDALKRAP